MNDQNRNKKLRSSIHFITKSETTWVLITTTLHINTAEDLLHFVSQALWHPRSPHQLSLPGSLARLTEKPFKQNYSGLTKWRRRKWTECAAMPCLTCASLSVLAPFPDLLLSSWPSRSCTTAGKHCLKSISIKYYRDYNHPDPHSSAMECNC